MNTSSSSLPRSGSSRIEEDHIFSDINWENRTAGTLIDWDDGHVPERFLLETEPREKHKTKLWRYNKNENRSRPFVCIHDDVLPPQLCHEIYQYTTHREEERPWGTYVRLEDFSRDKTCSSSSSTEDTLDAKDHLARKAAEIYWKHLREDHLGAAENDEKSRTVEGKKESEEDAFQNIHGIAVWALPAKTGTQVPYHLDYAEQIRYFCNIVVPPVWAGTLHCSPFQVEGGAYVVNYHGLHHYQKHGYKASFLVQDGNQNQSETMMEREDGWLYVPYRFNRLICQTGDLPHASTRVHRMEGHDSRRVMVGFNVFDKQFGPWVARAPEHSEAFLQMMTKSRRRNAQPTSLSLSKIQQSPALSRLLVAAKREKERQERLEKRQVLEKDIEEILLKTDARNVSRTVGDLAEQVLELSRSRETDHGIGKRSEIQDVHFAIHRFWKLEKLICLNKENVFDEDGLVSLSTPVLGLRN